MKLIPLTQGYFTKVDNDDFNKFAIYRWFSIKSRNGIRPSRQISVNGKIIQIQLSRAIMKFPENMQVDHINGDTLDNRKCNLRICTPSENSHNRKKSAFNTSGYKGVSWDKRNKKWRVMISCNNKQYYLGLFIDKIKAAKKYDIKAKELHKEFANLNFK